jgi:methylglutaconyl-CoA hydratase
VHKKKKKKKEKTQNPQKYFVMTSSIASSSVSLAVDTFGIARVTLQRAALHNAFNEGVIADVTSTFESLHRASTSAPVRAVVLQAEGASFSAGADLSWMQRVAKYSVTENIADAQRLFAMFHAIKTCPVPVVARVNGAALGGGAGLVACCDLAFGVDSAQIGFTEVKLGLIPAVISPFVIEKIGVTHASRLFLTGERILAPAAVRYGLLNESFASIDALDVALHRTLDELLTASPAATRAAKNLIQSIVPAPWKTHRDFVCHEIARIRASAEGQEGLAAFQEKRKPEWAKKQPSGAGARENKQ